MPDFIYKGETSREVRFPLGGIGAGCVSVDGSARFVDWEVMNRPNKDSYNGYSSICVKAEKDGRVLDVRALHGPLQPPFMGRGLHPFGGYTYGPDRMTLAGAPHFTRCETRGRFPEAEYSFAGTFPAKAGLRAFSPFEPGNDFDSSLPLAMFEVTLTNDTPDTLTYSVVFALANLNRALPVNDVSINDGRTRLSLGTAMPDHRSPQWGGLCLATDAPGVSVQRHWYRGTWFDGYNVFWHDLRQPGPIPPRDLPPIESVGTGDLPCPEHGVLCAAFTLEPGESRVTRFALAWYYPNYEKYWDNPAGNTVKPVWRNWYATEFMGAEAVTDYALNNWQKLSDAVRLFVDTLYNSTLPEPVIDAAGATLSVLKSPTCVRLTDGSFYGWEGSHARDGSCEGSCQHVWNYQYALPMLFPALERSMRELDYAYNLQPDGATPFRLRLPPGSPASTFRPCADGQMGGVVKTYRDWRWSGDGAWMKRLWPKVRRSLEYAWSPSNPDKWDPDETGMLTGRQHHTLDMELFGPNPWLTGMYLAALTAAERMALEAGDVEFAGRCASIRERGQTAAERLLWNGEYYVQQTNLDDPAALDPYEASDPNVRKTYWNGEAGQLKYQIGQGVSVDMMLGQWHADMVGLGDVFRPERVRGSLKSIYKYNFVESMGESFNPCRIYCLQDEAGLVICGYPDGAQRPVISVPYAEETMHGFEYAAACHMVMRGLEDEGLRVVKSVRDRYDGERRNPWNEIECGGNYARSMAAWALVPAYQGFAADLTRGEARFNRINSSERHASLWAIGGAWGKVMSGGGLFRLECYGGSITLSSIGCADRSKAFDKPLTLRAGDVVDA
ncbi:MAG: hypothetical protein LBS11_01780 [Oscillospiraceae bacterium]|jgi:uncharacterized protein (DUF608 family)|nr:hypothetical protein [Oscillospiraceae bacterium]